MKDPIFNAIALIGGVGLASIVALFML